MRLPLIAALSFAIPVGVQAGDMVRFSPDATLECMEDLRRVGTEKRLAGVEAACVGVSARECFSQEANPVAVDIAACMSKESEYWKSRADAAYERMMELAETADEDFLKTHQAANVPFQLTTDLEDMKAKWEDWREIRCAVEAMMRRGSSYTMTAAGSCTMKRWGEQALFLEQSVRYLESK
ncbi:uncharacterized protein DUF1311 [Rhodovulum imhoffii]|uniref:Uncharacterized protein DUF1311 n=1 Tax=Rhodovulum imhoffii TaxID=365340 RepID=A0A2T5BWI4_9RHOB|nr:lysozyme inhibitor LprI family protein [Rhodovulum imhoffii]MBK5935046.1 hypothetical protein [Rhodovulum imhoffii]PTN03989.1 uncharacterized protein DUF1311 [Rhodovulum imhoffii]